jgi:acetylornithine aminotransferase
VRPKETSPTKAGAADLRQTGILLMMDPKCRVGWVETGHLWGYENLGIEPDVLHLAKGLEAAFPSTLLCKSFCSNVFQTSGDHASTFGNPFACGCVCVSGCHTLRAGKHFAANVRSRGNFRTGLRGHSLKRVSMLVCLRCGAGSDQRHVDWSQMSPSGGISSKAALGEGVLLVPAGPKCALFAPR